MDTNQKIKRKLQLVKARSVARSRLKNAIERATGQRSPNRPCLSNKYDPELGCTPIELMEWIAGQWEPGMTWENRAIGEWHIDHIFPLAKMEDPVEILKKANHFLNLQPLWARENIKKSDSTV